MPNSLLTVAILFLRVGLGCFFLISGLLKLQNLSSFTEDIFNYQILFPPYDGYVAYLVTWLEIIAGLAIGIGFGALRGGLIVVAGLLITFITALSISASKGLNINCGCFGISEEVTNFPLHIDMNALLLLLTAGLFAYYSLSRKDKESFEQG